MMRVGWVGLFGLIVSTGALATDTLSRIEKTGTLRLGFRADAPPYSYRSGDGSPSGYMVDLCREISEVVKKSTGATKLKVEFVEITAADRLEAVRDGKIDVLCDPTSMTMSRRELVDFSLPTVIDGAGLLYRNTGPGHLADFAGKRIGVLQGTTTEETLKATLYKLDIEATAVPMKSHEDAIRAIIDKKLDAYFADRGILSYYLLNSNHRSMLKLEEQYYTFETYAVALPRGDGRLRLLVDATLADLYRSHAVRRIYTRSFGNTAPDEFMRALFVIHGVAK
ncbi:hypothetical protein DK26_15300 [Bosea sp. WAO]|uniref:amino acid ABC transporter substrate-binding protein n=1 Tax=Bosea sp. WAO TaxID=406341 RepID=UPI0007463EC2|nr:amino acid ABC transporter substrate-binding protein [Bosea sp. WAO]KUL94371.1 hypothetical protein DK26_15300 [Bosea sp. WAO]